MLSLVACAGLFGELFRLVLKFGCLWKVGQVEHLSFLFCMVAMAVFSGHSVIVCLHVYVWLQDWQHCELIRHVDTYSWCGRLLGQVPALGQLEPLIRQHRSGWIEVWVSCVFWIRATLRCLFSHAERRGRGGIRKWRVVLQTGSKFWQVLSSVGNYEDKKSELL